MSTSRKTNEYSVGGDGNVFSDHLFNEQPLLWGDEVSEEEAAKFAEKTTEYSVGAASNSETDRLFREGLLLWGVEEE